MKQRLVRMARATLWLLLIGGPLLYCALNVLVVVAENTMEGSGMFTEFSDIYIAGQPLARPAPAVHWEKLPALCYGFVVSMVKIGPLLLPAFIASFLLLKLGIWLIRRRRPDWAVREPRSIASLGGRLLSLVALAYGLGCLVHWLLPAAVFNPPTPPVYFHFTILEEYWWPYYGWPLPPAASQGWTIYAPLDVSFLHFATTKANCVKLSALVAVLLFYRYQRRRVQLAASTKSTWSA